MRLQVSHLEYTSSSSPFFFYSFTALQELYTTLSRELTLKVPI